MSLNLLIKRGNFSLPRSSQRQVKPIRGFTLVELAVVLVIIGLLLAIMIPSSSTMMSNNNRAQTLQKLKNIQSALNNYVGVNKRLPCPADGTALTGIEAPLGGATACDSNQGNGVVPWVTLGLTLSDILDAWNNQITYRVGYGLTVSNVLDMSSCDPSGSKLTTSGVSWTPPNINTGLCDSTTCTGTFAAANCTSPQNFLKGKGLNVSDGANLLNDYTLYTGAAYVLISHGDNGYGAINNSGHYQSNPIKGVAGTTFENANRNLSSSTILNAAPLPFIDTTFSDGSDAATYFDDILIHPSLISVINTAQLGPRSH